MLTTIKRFKNRFSLCTDYMFGREEQYGYPNEIVLELTNHCNLKCVTCPHPKMERTKGFMSMELIDKILEQAEGKIELVDLDMFGESLMHKQVFEIIEKCRAKGIATLLNTNMTWEPKELLQELATKGPDMLVLSIDGATKETYEAVRVGGKWEKVIENVDFFLNQTPRSYTVLQMVVSSMTESDVDPFMKYWKGKADRLRLHPYEVLDPECQDLAITVEGTAHKKPCVLPWRKMAISWDGTVVPCCADYDKIHPLGNASEQSISEIWNGEPLRDFRRKHSGGKAGDIKLCSTCNGFAASVPVLAGSVIVNSYNSKKILHVLDNLMVRKQVKAISY
jgi:radical SAM protein with 4Fe4S-binding SPASM domain